MAEDITGATVHEHEHEHERVVARLWEPSTVNILAILNILGGAIVAFAITWANPLTTVSDGVRMKVFNWYLFVLTYAGPFTAGMILIGLGQVIRALRECILPQVRRRR